jgi:metallo-beta-lactamase class B
MHLKRTYFLFIVFISGQLFCQDSTKLTIHHLVDRFFIYTTFKDLNGSKFPSNSMYLITEEGAVLFDTPWDTTQCQPLLDSIFSRHKCQVILVIATHYHDDRTAGLEFMKKKGIKTYSSKLTYDLCKFHRENMAEFYFVHDTTFKTGSYFFETFYPGEGHTKDNIVIWFATQKILYGGCLIKSTDNNSLGNIADANLKEWKPTIQKIIKKYPKPQFVIPGHFGWINNKSLQHTVKLLDRHHSSRKK